MCGSTTGAGRLSSKLGRPSAEEAKSQTGKSHGGDTDAAAGKAMTVADARRSSPSPPGRSWDERTSAAFNPTGRAAEAAEWAPLFLPPRRACGPRAAEPRPTLAAAPPPSTADAASGSRLPRPGFAMATALPPPVVAGGPGGVAPATPKLPGATPRAIHGIATRRSPAAGKPPEPEARREASPGAPSVAAWPALSPAGGPRVPWPTACVPSVSCLNS